MSLFHELKRRNVFRVGIAYAVGSWLLIQVADILLEAFEAPDWTLRFIVVFLAIGFPVAIFFAWAFELTPEGIKREAEVDRSQSITRVTGRKLNNTILVLMAVAIAYLLFDRFAIEREDTGSGSGPVAEREATSTPPVESDAPKISRQSIAVLPFANRSRLDEDAFFVEGIHDDLLTNLARIGSLKVISRTSMLRYKDTEKPIPEIAAELGVATVMEGAVQRSGNTVRINVQLIDAQTDEHLWADIFDRELTADNLFAIQSEISESIAGALKATLSPEEQRRITDKPTDDLAAYNAYLRGRQHMTRRTSADLEKALAELERAVELDPDFALAWASLAETLHLLPSYGTMNLVDARRRQEIAARRAIELNEHLGEGYVPLAEVYEFQERFEEAEAAFIKAIELSPGYATAYQWYADLLTNWPHRYAESLDLTLKAVELDPLSSILQLEVAEKLLILGRFDEAETQLDRLKEQDPGFSPTYSMQAAISGATGQFDRQVLALRRANELDSGRIATYIPQVFALLDLEDEANVERVRQAMSDLDDQHWANGLAAIFTNLRDGNTRAALETVRWVDRETGRQPSFQITFGFLHLIAGDYESAREAFRLGEPRFFARDTWREAIERQNGLGCVYAWVLSRTGDADMGRDLLDDTLAYLEDELPTYVEHADRFGYTDCYLVSGDIEKAMDAYGTVVAHGHYSGWWINTKLPWFEPLRGTPRFEAALEAIRENNVRQRENLAQMEAEAVL